ncbi:hypothetical protein [Myxococcus qinghaiensis]|uniref:hypothetical protein n=1 Tax=Myxococcus qinghaiensis TaxID=2906758 RepID=UPI0020A79F3A|nr:hypothetical protein [Myxococcus qinghaiensis]MCP3170231.1 hypothetical protein [Myxococcus qinghaiensis]
MKKWVPIDMDANIHNARQALESLPEGKFAEEMEEALGANASELERQGFPAEAATLRSWERKVSAHRRGEPIPDDEE